MKKVIRIVGKVFKWLLIVLLSLIVLLLIVRNIGRAINSRTPSGGINETQYVDINGQQMWINIYSENKENPILLYLHGGAGSPTSYGDYVILRKLAKDYTVVNWDQRNCGKTWLKDPQDKPITMKMMREDIDVLTDYLLSYLGKEKLTVMGISWGSFYGFDFAQRHPEKTECCIGLSMCLGWYEGAMEYHTTIDRLAIEFFKNFDELPDEGKELLGRFDEEDFFDAVISDYFTGDYMENENVKIYFELIEKYGDPLNKYMYENGYMIDLFDDCDENVIAAVLFNPYYTLPELYKTFITYTNAENGMQLYASTLITEFYTAENNHTLLGRTEYEMSVYMMLGDNDINCDPKKAEEYFNSISAPDKMLRYIHGGHESTMYHSEELAAFIHQVKLEASKLASGFTC